MIVNLGLVDLGGYEIKTDDPDFKVNGYIFRFSSKDTNVLKLRGWVWVNRLFEQTDDILDIRLFVNYDDPAVLVVALSLLRMFSSKIENLNVLFNDGRVVKF